MSRTQDGRQSKKYEQMIELLLKNKSFIGFTPFFSAVITGESLEGICARANKKKTRPVAEEGMVDD